MVERATGRTLTRSTEGQDFGTTLLLEAVWQEVAGALETIGVLQMVMRSLGDAAELVAAEVPIATAVARPTHRDHQLGFGKLIKVLCALDGGPAGTTFQQAANDSTAPTVGFDAFSLHRALQSATSRMRIVLVFATRADSDSVAAAHHGTASGARLLARKKVLLVGEALTVPSDRPDAGGSGGNADDHYEADVEHEAMDAVSSHHGLLPHK